MVPGDAGGFLCLNHFSTSALCCTSILSKVPLSKPNRLRSSRRPTNGGFSTRKRFCETESAVNPFNSSQALSFRLNRNICRHMYVTSSATIVSRTGQINHHTEPFMRGSVETMWSEGVAWEELSDWFTCKISSPDDRSSHFHDWSAAGHSRACLCMLL